jgi:hypothetical protein
MRMSPGEFAALLLELDAEGQPLPSAAFDELAEAAQDMFRRESEAVIRAVDADSKVALGLLLARLIVPRRRRSSGTRMRRDARAGKARGGLAGK